MHAPALNLGFTVYLIKRPLKSKANTIPLKPICHLIDSKRQQRTPPPTLPVMGRLFVFTWLDWREGWRMAEQTHLTHQLLLFSIKSALIELEKWDPQGFRFRVEGIRSNRCFNSRRRVRPMSLLIDLSQSGGTASVRTMSNLVLGH